MTMKNLILLAIVLALGGSAQAKLNVVATTSDFGALAREIGGDKINLTILAKPTEDPHFVEPKPSFLVQMRKADLVIEGGADLEEGWLHPLIDNSRNPRIGYDAKGHMHGSDGIELLEVPTRLDRSLGDQHAKGNPHYLVDPANARLVARKLKAKLEEVDSANASSYAANLERFEKALDEKLTGWLKKLEPYQGARIAAYHNSWPYFGRRFGLKIDLFLEPKPGIPPSPGHLAGVIKTMKEEKVKVIFVDAYVSPKTAQRVADETGAKLIQASHFPGAVKGVKDDYLSLIDHLVDQVAMALSKQ